MKKILFITAYVPSRKGGGENFTRLLLDNLAVNNKIDLAYFKYKNDRPYENKSHNIRVIKVLNNSTVLKLWNAVKVPFLHPVFTIRFSWRLLLFLRKMMKIEKYDLIYIDHGLMMLYGRFFKQTPKVMYSHDVMCQRFDRKSNFFVRKWIRFSEKIIYYIPNATIFCPSDKDKNIVKTAYGLNIKVTSQFFDSLVVNTMPQKIERRLVFFGKWDRPDNYEGLNWFVDKIYPKIETQFDIEIIGWGLPEHLVKKINGLQRIKYLGFVDNPYSIIANSYAVVAPLFSGAGVKVKVLESLGCGTPIFGSRIAFEGISEDYADFMLECETEEEYISLINYTDIPLQKRIEYKKMFIANYNKDSIATYIDRLS